MKYYQWKENLSVGIEEIDQQHKDIFKAAQEMCDAMSRGKGREKCYSLYQHLEKYIYDHFSLEELYMDKYGYDKREAMKKDHEEFRIKFGEFKQQLDEQGPSVNLVVKSMRWITDWLTDHILSKDMQLAEFLRPLISKNESSR